MKKSKFYDCCIFVALFIVGISLFVTLKLQIEMKNRIAVAAASQAPSTELFTARNNVTLAPHETRGISEAVTETSQALTIEETKRETTEKATEKTTVKPKTETTVASTELDSTLVVNTNSKKIHSSTCSYAGNMKEENKTVISSDELQAYLDEGYAMCSRCKGCKR